MKYNFSVYFIIGITCVILFLSIVTVVPMFTSDVDHGVVQQIDRVNGEHIARTNVSSVTNSTSEFNNTVGDKKIEPELSSGGSGTSSANSAVESILSRSPEFKGKAHILATVYSLCIDKYGYMLTIGIMGHINGEGSPGIVQFGHTVPKWDGSSPATSSASKPLYVRTQANIDAVRACGHPGNNTGFGMCQWTWYDRIPPLCDEYQKQLSSSGGQLSDQNLLDAEVNFFPWWIEHATPSYLQVFKSSSSYYLAGYNFCRYIGMNNALVASHEATFRKRGNYAEQISKLLEDGGFQHN